MADPKWNDTEPVSWDETEEISDVPSFDDTEEISDEPESTMSQAEAAILKAGEGASGGLTDILSGIGGVAVDALTGDDVDEQLKEQGFKLPEESLLESYRSARDYSRKRQEKAQEEYPKTSLAANIAGGAVSGSAIGGLAKGAGTAARIAQKLPGGQKITGLRSLIGEGVKGGALYGLGKGEADVTEEGLSAAGKNIGEGALEGAAGAALLGGAGKALKGTGGLVKGAGSLVSKSTLGKQFGLGRKAAQKGIDVFDDAQITQYVNEAADDIKKSINKLFKGNTKQKLLEEADELGIRVSTGENIDDVIQKVQQEGAFGEKEQKALTEFVTNLKSLNKEYNPKIQKAITQVEKQAAKKANVAARQGKEITRRTDFQTDFGDVAPLPEREGKLVGIEDIVKGTKTVKGKDVPTLTKKISQTAVADDIVGLKQYDLENMKPTELDELVRKVGTVAFGDGQDPAVQRYAKDLYRQLKDQRDLAMSSTDLPLKNQNLSNILSGLERIGIDPSDVSSGREVVSDKVREQLRQKLISGDLTAGEAQVSDLAKYVGRVDEGVGQKIKQESEFATDIAGFLRQSQGEGSVSPKAAFGTVPRLIGKAGNIYGKGEQNLQQAFKTLGDVTYVNKVIPKLTEVGGEAGEQYARVLSRAQEDGLPNRTKNAIIMGLMQQPGFRELLKRAEKGMGVEDVNGEED